MIAYDFESLVSLATQGKIAENFFQSNDLQKQKKNIRTENNIVLSILRKLFKNQKIELIMQILKNYERVKLNFIKAVSLEITIGPKSNKYANYSLFSIDFFQNLDFFKYNEKKFINLRQLIWDKVITENYSDVLILSDYFLK